MFKNLDKALKHAQWVSIPEWPHLEYPSKGGGAIRWDEAYMGRGGYPMWRCKRCKEWVSPNDESEWGEETPCLNQLCQAYFKLRWPGGIGESR